MEKAIGTLVEAEMHIAIPKFKLEVNINLKEILIIMGMADLFDEGLAALLWYLGKRWPSYFGYISKFSHVVHRRQRRG